MRPCLTLNFTSILNMTFEFYPHDIDKAWKDLEQSEKDFQDWILSCLLYTSPRPRDQRGSRMPSSA